MTIIVSVKINDGIIMASDSASTFDIGQTYLTADKIVNLVKGLPIGAMVTGAGHIGAESIATLLKDLRSRLVSTANHSWTLTPSYTMAEVAGRVREFLFEEKVAATPQPRNLDEAAHLRLLGRQAARRGVGSAVAGQGL